MSLHWVHILADSSWSTKWSSSLHLYILCFHLKIQIIIINFAWLKFFILPESHLFSLYEYALSELRIILLLKFQTLLYFTCLSMSLVYRFISIFWWKILFFSFLNINILFLLITSSISFWFRFRTIFIYFFVWERILLICINLIIFIIFYFWSIIFSQHLVQKSCSLINLLYFTEFLKSWIPFYKINNPRKQYWCPHINLKQIHRC